MEDARRRFAANLKQRRDGAENLAEGVGDLAGLHPTEISLLERSPRLETIVTLARALEALDAACLLSGII
jgi:predicted urease superfamily metal-dependent hydrolase